MERISGTNNPTKDPRQPGDLFTTETAGLPEVYAPGS